MFVLAVFCALPRILRGVGTTGSAFVAPRPAQGRPGGQVFPLASVRAPERTAGEEGHHGAGLHRP